MVMVLLLLVVGCRLSVGAPTRRRANVMKPTGRVDQFDGEFCSARHLTLVSLCSVDNEERKKCHDHDINLHHIGYGRQSRASCAMGSKTCTCGYVNVVSTARPAINHNYTVVSRWAGQPASQPTKQGHLGCVVGTWPAVVGTHICDVFARRQRRICILFLVSVLICMSNRLAGISSLSGRNHNHHHHHQHIRQELLNLNDAQSLRTMSTGQPRATAT